MGLLTTALPKPLSHDARTDEDAARRRAAAGVPADPGPVVGDAA
ncbi:hypothetical protein ACIQ1J_33425 [Streptomyces sp. NPDC097107]